MIYEIDEIPERASAVRDDQGLPPTGAMLSSPIALGLAAVAFVGATAFAPLLLLAA